MSTFLQAVIGGTLGLAVSVLFVRAYVRAAARRAYVRAAEPARRREHSPPGVQPDDPERRAL